MPFTWVVKMILSFVPKGATALALIISPVSVDFLRLFAPAGVLKSTPKKRSAKDAMRGNGKRFIRTSCLLDCGKGNRDLPLNSLATNTKALQGRTHPKGLSKVSSLFEGLFFCRLHHNRLLLMKKPTPVLAVSQVLNVSLHLIASSMRTIPIRLC